MRLSNPIKKPNKKALQRLIRKAFKNNDSLYGVWFYFTHSFKIYSDFLSSSFTSSYSASITFSPEFEEDSSVLPSAASGAASLSCL